MKLIINYKKKLCLLLILILTMFTAFPMESIMAKNEDKSSGKKDYIVIAKDNKGYQNQSNKQKDKINKEKSNKKMLKENNTLVVELSTSEALELSKNADVLLIEEDIIVTTNLSESFELEVINDIDEEDYVPDEQITPWNIHAVKGSKEYLGDNALQQGIKVGILDSGIEIMAEIEVAERINFTGVDDTGAFASMYEDMTGHGTAVAGIIGAIDDDMGIVGINPNADIYSLKVFDDNNQAPLSRIIEAIQYAIDNDIKILNMSFGTTVNSMALYLKIREAYEADMLMVASAGNKGVIEYPAAYDEVMSVGATNMQHQIAPFSTSGTSFEILAPGTPVMTTGLFGGYMVVEGTSISVPHVVGAASLLWAKDITKSSDFIRQLINVSARTIDGNNSGNGLLDIENAFMLYEDFVDVYVPNIITYKEYGEIYENYSDLDEFYENYVVGSWKAESGHDTTIDESGYLAAYVELMKKASKDADHETYAPAVAKINMILHGGTILNETNFNPSNPSIHTGQNYVSDIRYLYAAALAVSGGLTIPNPAIYSGVSTGLDTITRYIVNKTISTDSIEATNAGKAAKILGFAIHLAGDVYAHRALVETTAGLTSANFVPNGNCDMHFIKKQAFLKTLVTNPEILCKHYTCLVQGINAGVIETKDITTWGGSASIYEDCTTYFPQRFYGAKYTVKYILGKFSAKSALTDELFISGAYPYKLNGLYKFYAQTGWSTGGVIGGAATNLLR